MTRLTVALALLAGGPLTLPAQDPKAADPGRKPQWQRALTGADARRAEDLEAGVAAALQAGKRDEAIRLAEQVAALRARVQGEDHWEARDTRHALANLKLPLTPAQRTRLDQAGEWNETFTAQFRRGRFPEAADLAAKVLEARRAVLGETARETADARSNLADVYRELTRYAEAEELCLRALKDTRAALGDMHPDTAISLNNLAGLYESQGRYAEAEPLYREALRVKRDALGDRHPATALTLNNLAVLYRRQDRLAEAEPLLREALRINREVLGDKDPNTATSLNNLASVCEAQGKYAEAERLFQEALRLQRRAAGDNHPGTATSLSNLANLFHVQGRHEAAEPLLRDALRILRAARGDKHPDTATVVMSLAMLYRDQGRLAEAEPLIRDALRVRIDTLTDRHPAVAEGLNNLAAVYESQGRYAEAEPLYQEALRLKRATVGGQHSTTVTGLSNLAHLYLVQRRYAEAEPLLRDALRLSTEVRGAGHPSTALYLNNLAALYKAWGKYDEAEDLYRDALRRTAAALGDDHPSTAASRNNLAAVTAARGRVADAEPLFERAVRTYESALGERHPDTTQGRINLAALYQGDGRLAAAEALLGRAVQAHEANRLLRAPAVERALGRPGVNPAPPLAAVLAGLGRPIDAFRVVEADLARGLLDDQAGRGGARLTAAEERARADLAARLAAADARILRLATRPKRTPDEEAELAALTADRRRDEDSLKALAAGLSRRAVADPGLIQASLAPDAALLAWVDVTSADGRVQQHWACVVRRSGDPHWEPLPGTGSDGRWTAADGDLPALVRAALRAAAAPADLSRLVEEFGDRPEVVRALREAAASPARRQDLFARLAAQRVAPVRKHLDGVRTLLVVPTYDMAGVPVEVLAPDVTVGYVPSGTALARRAKPPAGPAGLLALGDAVYDPGAPVRPTALPTGGLLIELLDPRGSAAKAGVRPNDVLLKYGDAAVTSADDLKAAIQKGAAAGGKVPLALWRVDDGGKPAEFARNVPPGPLGVVVATDPAPVALAARRRRDAALAGAGGRWADLPCTRYEVSRIARLFDRAEVLLDDRASEPAVDRLRQSGDLARYRYLHFAVHGQGNAVRAFDSALILSQDRPPEKQAQAKAPLLDNRVTAREVLDLWKLDADLVTLSACETAVGLSAGGDGMLGFAQAFLLAGSRSVCLSLWKVDDTATGLLMARFYENLLGKRDGLRPMPKIDALREAKEWLRNLTGADALRLGADLRKGVIRAERKDTKDVPPVPKEKADTRIYADPSFWAAFILVGDPD